MPTLSKLYTMQEASQHSTKDDCWVVIDGKMFQLLGVSWAAPRMLIEQLASWKRLQIDIVEVEFGRALPLHVSETNINWTAFQGILTPLVYDVTSYLDDHPGGDDVVLAATGKDATDDFEDAGHSNDAKQLMETFCIGELDTSSEAIPELEISSKKQAAYAQKLVDLTKQYWVVPVAVVGVSVVVGFLYLRKK